MVYNRFIYNDNAGEQGGGGQQQEGDAAPATEVVVEQPAITLADLQSLGFESFEQLKAHLHKPSEPTQEELDRQAQLEKADFLKYGTEKGLITVDEYQKFEAIKNRENTELVFDSFKSEYLEENPDADDDDVKEAFNDQYHINSTNPVLQKRGLKMLEKEANELKAPHVTKYETAHSKFKQERELVGKVKGYNEFVEKKIAEIIGEKKKVYEKDINGKKIAVEIELTAEQRANIAEKLKNSYKNFDIYNNEGAEKLVEVLERKANGILFEEKRNEIFEKIFEQAVQVGVQKGSTVGATMPFPLIDGAVVRSITAPQDAIAEMKKSHAQAKANIR